MEFTYENVGVNTFLVYKMCKNDRIDTLVKGMTENNKIAGILPFSLIQENSDRYIKYNISSKVTLEQFFSGMLTRRRLLGVFSSIADAVLDLEQYMIEPSRLMFDMEHVYVNVSTAEVGLLCIPLADWEEKTGFREFLKKIVFESKYDPGEENDYVAELINFLNTSPNFSMQEFKEFLSGLEKESLSQRPQRNPGLAAAPKPAVEQPSRAAEYPNRAMEHPNLTAEQIPGSVVRAAQAGRREEIQPESGQQKGRAGEEAGKEEKKKKGLFFFHKKEEPEKTVKKEKPTKPEKPAKAAKPAKPAKQEKQAKAEKKGKTVSAKGFCIPGQEIPMSGGTVSQAVPEPDSVSQNAQSLHTGNAYSQLQSISAKPAAMNFGETTVLSQGSAGETTVLGVRADISQVLPFLMRRKNHERIYLTKDEFKIGKEKSYVDYCINDNPTVSRSHADILKRDGRYYVRDNNSLNHTYVNGELIQGISASPLEHGAEIKISDEIFEIKFHE